MSHIYRSEHLRNGNQDSPTSLDAEDGQGNAGSLSDEVDEEVVERCERTVRLIQNLPSDLCNMVMSSLWEAAFCPGSIYLAAHVNYNLGEDYKNCPSAAKPTLLALSKGIHAGYRTRFWSENTFVIGVDEPPNYTETDFVGWLPDEASNHVKKVDVIFTTRDLGPFYTISLPPNHPCWEPCPRFSGSDGEAGLVVVGSSAIHGPNELENTSIGWGDKIQPTTSGDDQGPGSQYDKPDSNKECHQYKHRSTVSRHRMHPREGPILVTKTA